MGKTAASKQSRMDRFHASGLGKLKLKLQFTGWLQYIIGGVFSAIFLLLAGLGALVSNVLFWVPMAVAVALLSITLFDLITVKLRLHPAEAIPKPLAGLDIFDVMRARRSCRSFQNRNLLPEHLAATKADAAHFSAAQRQIGDKPIRLEYINAPLTVWPVVGCEEFLVAIVPRAYDRMAIIDIGRSLQKVVLRATERGMATCWIGPGANQASVIRHLADRFDPEKDHVVCVCAIGYKSFYKPVPLRFMGMGQHKRLPINDLFFSDADFKSPLVLTAAPVNRFGRCFEVCQWGPSSFNSQTTRGVMAKNGTRMDFYASTASRYYAAVALGIWCANWEIGCDTLGIDGHFDVFSQAERGVKHPPTLPRYDVSWHANTK